MKIRQCEGDSACGVGRNETRFRKYIPISRCEKGAVSSYETRPLFISGEHSLMHFIHRIPAPPSVRPCRYIPQQQDHGRSAALPPLRPASVCCTAAFPSAQSVRKGRKEKHGNLLFLISFFTKHDISSAISVPSSTAVFTKISCSPS